MLHCIAWMLHCIAWRVSSGDTWRTRHDTCKVAIARECLASKLPHDVEVYGLFAHLLPAVLMEQGGDLQWARARQGLVPDFRIRLPTPQGPQDSLAELKVISAGVTWHPRGAPGTGVEKRAATLEPHYRRELASMTGGSTTPGRVK